MTTLSGGVNVRAWLREVGLSPPAPKSNDFVEVPANAETAKPLNSSAARIVRSIKFLVAFRALPVIASSDFLSEIFNLSCIDPGRNFPKSRLALARAQASLFADRSTGR